MIEVMACGLFLHAIRFSIEGEIHNFVPKKEKTMTTIELESRKLEVIQAILHIDNGDLLEKIYRHIRKSIREENALPCAYTLEEVRQRLAVTQDDALSGKGISEEEANRLIDKML